MKFRPLDGDVRSDEMRRDKRLETTQGIDVDVHCEYDDVHVVGLSSTIGLGFG